MSGREVMGVSEKTILKARCLALALVLWAAPGLAGAQVAAPPTDPPADSIAAHSVAEMAIPANTTTTTENRAMRLRENRWIS